MHGLPESTNVRLLCMLLQVRLDKSGVEEVRELGELNTVEQKGVDDLIPVLEGNINKGVEFAKTPGNEK